MSAPRLSHSLFSYASTYFEHLIKHSHSVTVSLTLCLTQSAISLSCYTLMPSIVLSIVLNLSRSLSILNSHSTDALTHSLFLALSPYYLTPQLTLSLTLLYLVSFLHLVFFTICVYCIYKQLCRLIIIPLSYLCIYVYKNVNHKKNHKKTTTYFIVSVNGRRTLTCLSHSKQKVLLSFIFVEILHKTFVTKRKHDKKTTTTTTNSKRNAETLLLNCKNVLIKIQQKNE